MTKRRRRPLKLQPIEKALQQALGTTSAEQLELQLTGALAAATAFRAAFAPEEPCTACARRGYHLASCPRSKP